MPICWACKVELHSETGEVVVLDAVYGYQYQDDQPTILFDKDELPPDFKLHRMFVESISTDFEKLDKTHIKPITTS
jgi:hypothetical protein